MSDAKELLPLARTEALVVKELHDEMLVYDLKRDKAHCLNPTAASVWKRCDGKLAVTDMASLLEKELKLPVKDEIVWLAVQQLNKFHLLQEQTTVPTARPGLSRRELVRTLGVSALLLPAIISITAPPVAQAQSCLGIGAACTSGAQCCSQCCSGGFCASFAQNCG
ncbi:MAG: PqqD family protein [Pyrinomonadaceae bacterium]